MKEVFFKYSRFSCSLHFFLKFWGGKEFGQKLKDVYWFIVIEYHLELQYMISHQLFKIS